MNPTRAAVLEGDPLILSFSRTLLGNGKSKTPQNEVDSGDLGDFFFFCEGVSNTVTVTFFE